MAEPSFVKLGMNIMATKPISTACFINPSHQSMCLYAYTSLGARHWFSINVTTAMNTRARTDELLEATLSMLSVSYEGRQVTGFSWNF
jgi:hypothetical protein